MDIVDLKVTPVAVPLKPRVKDLYNAKPDAPSYMPSVLVEILTDEGITGIGEAHIALGADVTKLILESVRNVILGENPMDAEVIKKKLYAACNLTHLHIHAANWALSGIDMALWDLVGKASKRPLYQLWGGAFRKKIQYYAHLVRTDPAGVAQQSNELLAEGFSTLVLKVGFDPDEDVECVKAMRETASTYSGSIEIRMDANQSWSPGQAVRMIKKMAKYDPEFIDQPTLMYDLDGLARVRRSVNVPIASHESSWTFYNVMALIKRGAADVIYVDPRFDAGFGGAKISAGIAEAAGIPALAHQWAMTGVSTAAYMQLIASTPNFIFANEGGGYGLADDVVKGGLPDLNKGCLDLLEGPGIGVELDPVKVQKYAQVYDELFMGKGFAKTDVTPYQLMAYRRYFGH